MTHQNLSAPPRAKQFQEFRKQRLLEIVEDYTEMIADLILSHGKARVCDIAREMGISHVSVLKTINRLIRDDYLVKDEHHSIELTVKGRELATFSKKKHLILLEFLRKLGVSEHAVLQDVEGIEHHISTETLEAIETHLNFLQRINQG